MEEDCRGNEGLVPISAVARQLGFSKPHVYNLAKRGELPSIKFGRTVRISPKDLEEYVREHRRKKGMAA